jgi:hypothetical protein
MNAVTHLEACGQVNSSDNRAGKKSLILPIFVSAIYFSPYSFMPRRFRLGMKDFIAHLPVNQWKCFDMFTAADI